MEGGKSWEEFGNEGGGQGERRLIIEEGKGARGGKEEGEKGLTLS
jgi:hypothetical protein